MPFTLSKTMNRLFHPVSLSSLDNNLAAPSRPLSPHFNLDFCSCRQASESRLRALTRAAMAKASHLNTTARGSSKRGRRHAAKRAGAVHLIGPVTTSLGLEPAKQPRAGGRAGRRASAGTASGQRRRRRLGRGSLRRGSRRGREGGSVFPRRIRDRRVLVVLSV